MIREAITHVVAGATLSEGEAAAVMEEIMTGVATEAQMGSFLTALRMRPGGETVQEIAGLARVMREKAVQVHLEERIAAQAMDTCGTGGDGAGTFNVSTGAGNFYRAFACTAWRLVPIHTHPQAPFFFHSSFCFVQNNPWRACSC